MRVYKFTSKTIFLKKKLKLIILTRMSIIKIVLIKENRFSKITKFACKCH